MSDTLVERSSAPPAGAMRPRRRNWLAIAGIAVLLLFLVLLPVLTGTQVAYLKVAQYILIGAVGLQMLVYTPLGYENDGNTNWLRIAGQVVQPSEFIKLALAVWAGFILWRKQELLGRWKHVFIPLIPVGTRYLDVCTVCGRTLDVPREMAEQAAATGQLR